MVRYDDEYESQYEALSLRQRNILSFIESFIDKHAYPPTIRQIGEACRINSTSVVNYNLNRLAESGWLARDADVSRAIRLLRRRTPAPGLGGEVRGATPMRVGNAVRVPKLGLIAAGQAISPYTEDLRQGIDQDMDMLEIPREMIGGYDPAEVFALRVQGDSMIDALIEDGDWVVLRMQQTCNDGDMVAVWMPDPGATTLKMFYDEGSVIRLQPRNPAYEPIFVHPNNCLVQGKVLGIIRVM